jgi:hypothetical protein
MEYNYKDCHYFMLLLTVLDNLQLLSFTVAAAH